MRQINFWFTFLVSVVLAAPAAAQADSNLPEWARVRQQVPKRALVIGVGRYDVLPSLETPERDAAIVAAKLSALGFEVHRPANELSWGGILDALDAFKAQLREGDVALVYFSGHGFERGESNYIAPKDMPRVFAPERVGFVAVSLDHIMDELAATRSAIMMILLDACREDPFPQGGATVTLSGRKGLAPVAQMPTGVFLGFAAAPGKASWSLVSGDPPNSPSLFSRHLVTYLGAKGTSLYWTWREAGAKVNRDTGQQQTPWYNADYFFPEYKPMPGAADREEYERAWAMAVSNANPVALQAELEDYLRHFPDSPFASAARAKIGQLQLASAINMTIDREQQIAANQTRLALETRAIVGSATSGGIAASFADLNEVFTARTTQIRVRAEEGAETIATLPQGTRLSALSLPNGEGWMKVRLPTGAIGFLGSVATVKQREDLPADALTFATGETAIGSTQIDPSFVQAARQADAVVGVEISSASAELPDRARKLAYLRGLAVRSALVAQGIRPDRVKVQLLSRNPAATDEAVLRMLR